MTRNNLFSNMSRGLERELSIILGKISHHIHPDIVSFITEENMKYEKKFESICHKNCNIKSFFYPGSDCVFPGFRRPINKEKVRGWKNNICEEDGTILNDNTFPRHIWAYLSMNKAYSGGSLGVWGASGLDQFELAHIFGHKQDERKLEKIAFAELDSDHEPYGLFTSASNVVLIPKGFAKPTDGMVSVKICFYKRHLDLYGNNLIGLSGFYGDVPSWYEEIDWIDPVLPVDWMPKMQNLLRYREKYLMKKYAG